MTEIATQKKHYRVYGMLKITSNLSLIVHRYSCWLYKLLTGAKINAIAQKCVNVSTNICPFRTMNYPGVIFPPFMK